MSRIPMLDVEGQAFQRTVAHWPEAREGIWGLYERLTFSGALEVPLKEEIRRTLAHTGGCVYCASLGEATPAAQQEDRRTSLAVGFAELFGRDPDHVDASAIEVLREDFSDAEVVELIVWCSWCLFGQHVGGALGVEPARAEDVDAFRAWQRSGPAAA